MPKHTASILCAALLSPLTSSCHIMFQRHQQSSQQLCCSLKSPGEAMRFPVKVQTWRLLCFQEILQRACGAAALAGPQQEDNSCLTEGGE